MTALVLETQVVLVNGDEINTKRRKPEGHLSASSVFKSLTSVPGSAVYSTTTPSWFAKMNLSLRGGDTPAVEAISEQVKKRSLPVLGKPGSGSGK